MGNMFKNRTLKGWWKENKASVYVFLFACLVGVLVMVKMAHDVKMYG